MEVELPAELALAEIPGLVRFIEEGLNDGESFEQIFHRDCVGLPEMTLRGDAHAASNGLQGTCVGAAWSFPALRLTPRNSTSSQRLSEIGDSLNFLCARFWISSSSAWRRLIATSNSDEVAQSGLIKRNELPFTLFDVLMYTRATGDTTSLVEKSRSR